MHMCSQNSIVIVTVLMISWNLDGQTRGEDSYSRAVIMFFSDVATWGAVWTIEWLFVSRCVVSPKSSRVARIILNGDLHTWSQHLLEVSGFSESRAPFPDSIIGMICFPQAHRCNQIVVFTWPHVWGTAGNHFTPQNGVICLGLTSQDCFDRGSNHQRVCRRGPFFLAFLYLNLSVQGPK